MDTSGLEKYFREFQNESDRACALLGAAYLDARLGDLLRARMSSDVDHDALLNGPLRNFADRISVCAAFRMLTTNEATDLRIVRRIRNEFAHSDDFTLSFQNERIKSMAGGLQIPRSYLALPEAITSLGTGDLELAAIRRDYRKRFELTVACLIVQLQLRLSGQEPLEVIDALARIGEMIEGIRCFIGSLTRLPARAHAEGKSAEEVARCRNLASLFSETMNEAGAVIRGALTEAPAVDRPRLMALMERLSRFPQDLQRLNGTCDGE